MVTGSSGTATAGPSWTVYIGSEISGALRVAVEVCVRVMGGKVAESIDEAVAAEGSSNGKGASNEGYIVCLPAAYATYVKTRERHYIPLVTPAWAFRSVLHNAQVLLPTEKFSANPRKLFSSIVLYTAQVEVEPDKVIRSLITHGGGQVVSHPSRSATHMICLRPEGKEFLQALNWNAEGAMLGVEALADSDVATSGTSFLAGGCRGSIPDCVLKYIMGQCQLSKHHIVSYNWVQESVHANRLLAENLYGFDHKADAVAAPPVVLSDVVMALQRDATLFPPPADATPVDIWKDISQNSANQWTSEAFVLAEHIATRLRQRMLQAIQAMGAKVLVLAGDDPGAMEAATHVVCAYQTGRAYELAMTLGKPVVGLQWLAASLALRTLLPMTFEELSIRNVLWYPAKKFGSIPGMESLIVTLSGFTARSTPSRDDMQAIIRLTGACWLPVLSRSHTTHLICLEPTGEKYKRAITWSCQNVVKLEWILQCVKQWRYLPEADFTWAGKPKLPKFDVHDALAVLDTAADKEITPLKPKDADAPKPPAVPALTTPVLLRTTQPDEAAPEPAAKGQKAKKAPAKAKTPTPKTKPPKAKEPKTKGLKTEEPKADAPAQKAVASKEGSKAGKAVKRPRDEPSTAFVAAKAVATSKRVAKSGAEDDDVVVVKRTVRTKAPKRVFLLTGTHEEIAINESIVQFLGGVVVHSQRAFDPTCTHVICRELRRTEKIVAACAAGKWILTPEYLRDSRAQGLFLCEEGYEWGLDKVSKDHYCDPRVWLPVAKYWRTTLAGGGARALEGWTLALLGDTVPPPSMCAHVIAAAGGVLVDVAALLKQFKAESDPPMLVLVAEDVKKSDKTLKELVRRKVPRVKPGFLVDYITKDQTARPRIEDYLA
ncbi:hypothetical protein ACHHYP_10085 [Achlya hypogyna]|uniref:BRCT domain-containing protein n=1 Tax=Achlya hypogyna TaxID=1202772 RepID=A0A1V9ZIC0_ACHHY|nr:hypothetical protein ACHHYP_10085 [Achlya hypogyna]